MGQACRLVGLDMFCIAKDTSLDFLHKAYFIHRCLVGQIILQYKLKLSLVKEEVMKSSFKWNVSHLNVDVTTVLQEQ